jgi:hypothetical protein
MTHNTSIQLRSSIIVLFLSSFQALFLVFGLFSSAFGVDLPRVPRDFLFYNLSLEFLLF